MILSPLFHDPSLSNTIPMRSNAQRANRRRLIVFASTFAIACTASLAYTFLRPAEYRASTQVQITPGVLDAHVPPAPGTFQADTPGEQLRPLLTEAQVLRSRPLIEATLERLQRLGTMYPRGDRDPVSDVQAALQVEAYDATNLVEVSATLPEREFVAPLLNTLVSVYRERLSESFGSTSGDALARASEEAKRLEAQVAEKRKEVENFRSRNGIVSAENEENEVLSRVRGLNTSLNLANDKVATAEGRLRSLMQSAAAGKSVVRTRDHPTLANLEQRASALKAQLRELERNFTADYLALDPTAKAQRAQLTELEQQIKVEREAAGQAALAEAQEEVASAREAATRLQQQIASDRQTVQLFTARLNQYKAMRDELAELERLYRDRAQRKASLEASEKSRSPSIAVLQAAARPDRAWRPDYVRDALLSLGGSLLFALFAMGLVELFNRSDRQPAVLISQPITLHGLPVGPPQAQLLPRTTLTPVLESSSYPLLGADPLPSRELSEQELFALWEASAPRTRVAILLLLSGPSADELLASTSDDVDLAAGRMRVRSASPREIVLQPATLHQLQACGLAPGTPLLTTTSGDAVSRDELEADLLCAAHDAGLARPDEVTPAALRHAYILFLLRQGVRMSDLVAIVGRLPTAVISAYGQLAPPGPRVTRESTQLAFPLLARVGSVSEPRVS